MGAVLANVEPNVAPALAGEDEDTAGARAKKLPAPIAPRRGPDSQACADGVIK